MSLHFPSKEVLIRLSDTQIILPHSPSAKTRLAAQELQTHLKIAYGDEVPILQSNEGKSEAGDKCYKFYLNRVPQNRHSLQEKAGANYLINQNAAFFWGKSSMAALADKNDAQNRSECQATLYAVYEFLEQECGFRWLAPGKLWRVRVKQDSSLKVKQRHVRWMPEVVGGRFPRLLRRAQALEKGSGYSLDRGELELWLLRQRAGGSYQDGNVLEISLPTTGLPVGEQKVVCEELNKLIQEAEQPAAVVTEGALGCGGLQMLRDYFILRNVSRRKESMRESMNDFFAAFGPVSDEVQDYFQLWSVLYGKDFMSILSSENNSIAYKNTEKYYRIFRKNYGEGDFRRAKSILESAAAENHLTKREKARLDSLRLAYEHAAQTFAALSKLNGDDRQPDEFAEGLEAARGLRRFRKAVGTYADGCIESIRAVERMTGDVCGIGLVNSVDKDAEPLARVGPEWYFRTVDKEADVSNLLTGSGSGFYKGWTKYIGREPSTAAECSHDLGQYLMASDFSLQSIKQRNGEEEISMVLWGLSSPVKVYLDGDLLATVPEAYFTSDNSIVSKIKIDDLKLRENNNAKHFVVIKPIGPKCKKPSELWRGVWLFSNSKPGED